MNIGLFYGSSTCYTEIVAEKIATILGSEWVKLHNVKNTPLSQMCTYPVLILGMPTWDFGELQEDWAARWQEWEDIDLTGHLVALFGLGDQQGYGEWFQDALGILHDKLLEKGATVVGYWPNQGYQFEASKALVDDGRLFVGLALDEASQYQQTDGRLSLWLEQLLSEIQTLN